MLWLRLEHFAIGARIIVTYLETPLHSTWFETRGVLDALDTCFFHSTVIRPSSCLGFSSLVRIRVGVCLVLLEVLSVVWMVFIVGFRIGRFLVHSVCGLLFCYCYVAVAGAGAAAQVGMVLL